MNYEVGDSVTVRDDLIVGITYGDCRFIRCMICAQGKVVHITEILDGIDNRYKVEGITNAYFSSEMFVTNQVMPEDYTSLLCEG